MESTLDSTGNRIMPGKVMGVDHDKPACIYFHTFGIGMQQVISGSIEEREQATGSYPRIACSLVIIIS
jgi:hypothetical protein